MTARFIAYYNLSVSHVSDSYVAYYERELAPLLDHADQYREYQMWLGRLDAQEDISPERPVNLYDYDWEIRRGIVNAIQSRGGVDGHDAVNIIVEGVLREAGSADWQLQTDTADLEGHLRHIV